MFAHATISYIVHISLTNYWQLVLSDAIFMRQYVHCASILATGKYEKSFKIGIVNVSMRPICFISFENQGWNETPARTNDFV